MRRHSCLLVAVLLSMATAFAQTPPTPEKRPAAADASPAEAPAAARARRIRALEKSLEDVVLRGMFQATGPEGLRGEAPLSTPRAERYEIEGARRIEGDRWVISARIEFDGNVLTLPIYVNVEWAGDTPVITVDDLTIPGMQTYSARVMLYRGFYSGVWMGQTYGGVLSGQIIPRDAEQRVFGKLGADTPAAAGDKAPLRTVQTAGGAYKVSYRTDPPTIPLNELFSMDVYVAGPELDKVELQVDADMPAHRHGMNTAPRVTTVAPGHYRVAGMNLHMAGEWVITFDLRRGAVTERAEATVEMK